MRTHARTSTHTKTHRHRRTHISDAALLRKEKGSTHTRAHVHTHTHACTREHTHTHSPPTCVRRPILAHELVRRRRYATANLGPDGKPKKGRPSKAMSEKVAAEKAALGLVPKEKKSKAEKLAAKVRGVWVGGN